MQNKKDSRISLVKTEKNFKKFKVKKLWFGRKSAVLFITYGMKLPEITDFGRLQQFQNRNYWLILDYFGVLTYLTIYSGMTNLFYTCQWWKAHKFCNWQATWKKENYEKVYVHMCNPNIFLKTVDLSLDGIFGNNLVKS